MICPVRLFLEVLPPSLQEASPALLLLEVSLFPESEGSLPLAREEKKKRVF